MRPFEIGLMAANLLAFFSLVMPLPGMLSWARLFAPFALLAAGAQVLIEGSRWQLVPGYALSGLFFIIWLAQAFLPASAPSLPRLGNLLAAGLGVLALALSIALPLVFPVFRFPAPGGPYAIGTVTYHWVDSDRPEIFTNDPADLREVMVQVWYPAQAGPSSPRSPYVEHAEALAPLPRLIHLPGFLLGHFKYVQTNAVQSAPAADDRASYPVLIFSHGRGGYRQNNTLLVEELVSHGYVVAAIDHPYAAAGVVFPDGRLVDFDERLYDPEHPGHPAYLDAVLPHLAQDVIFALDKLEAVNRADPQGILTGLLNLERAGVVGSSLGGAIGAEACWMDPRLKACLVLDVFVPADAVASGLRQPVMWITRDAATMQREGWTQADIDETQNTMRAVYQKLPGDGYIVLVPGMYHADIADTSLITPLTGWLGISGPVSGSRVREIIKSYSLAFFDRHLKGQPEALLDGPADAFPEVLFETRRSAEKTTAPGEAGP